MQIKIDLDIDSNELLEGIKAELNKATSVVFGEAVQKAKEMAGTRLGKSGLDHWTKGFRAHQVNDDMYVIEMEGKLASWMEDGIKVGEISQAVMSGNRAIHNRAEGKNYVDVPFMKDADAGGNIKGTNVNVRAFADADSMIKSVKMSDYKSKSIREEKRMVSRIKDIIKSTQPEAPSSTQFLTIRRVTPDSVWPKTPFEGAKVFEDLGDWIDQRFNEVLEKVL